MRMPPSRVLDNEREETFHVAGDQPDPLDAAGHRGVVAETRLDAQAKHPRVRYRDFLLECDLYETPGAPLKVILICPRCRNTLTIQGDRKKIEYSATDLVEHGGRLSIEPFRCTWEAGEGRRMEFGLGLCQWTVGIDNNVARDA